MPQLEALTRRARASLRARGGNGTVKAGRTGRSEVSVGNAEAVNAPSVPMLSLSGPFPPQIARPLLQRG